MKILYDGWIFSCQAAGGVNRYFANLIDGLPDDCWPALTTHTIPAVNWPRNPNLKVLQSPQFRPRRVSQKLELPYINRVTASPDYDIFHPTFYSSLANKDWQSYGHPVVLTVYDMIYERFADTLDPQGKHREEKRKAIVAAQALLCISQHTKNDLVEYYKLDEAKISVIYLAADLNSDSSHGPEPVPERPYFLYVGSRASYKNFDGLLQALASDAVNNDVALCVVGPPLTTEENRRIAELKLSARVEHYGFASDAQLAKLYRCSLAFVYPSLYEGFGIPPLEAMQCGTLVVASDVTSIPEVVGDGGILFDPYSADDLTEILRSVTDGSVDRQSYIKKGRRRASEFSWDKTVAATVDVYRSLAAADIRQN